MKKYAIFWVVLAFLLPLHAAAQEEAELRLSLSRDFGASFGSQIRGTFSMRVTGPDDLAQVEFFIDGRSVGVDTEAPFRLQFQTGSFTLGVHTMNAIGTTVNGRELRSNEIQREFVSASASNNRTVWIIIPLLVLIVGGRLLSNWLSNRGQTKPAEQVVNGPWGGTICPNCHKPYALHWWSFRLVLGRFDRCPHCGSWRFVRPLHPEVLNASVEAMVAAEAEEEGERPSEDTLRRKLDDSRYVE